MKKITFFLLVSFVCSLFSVHAQSSFELPANIQLNAKDDYAKYEQTIIDAANWLETTDMDKDAAKRKSVDAFVVHWTTGAPSVTIDIGETLYTITKGNPELLALYLASYSRYVLQNKSTAGKFSATHAALVSIITVYKKGIAVARNRDMEKLVKLMAGDKLDTYIEENFKIPKA